MLDMKYLGTDLKIVVGDIVDGGVLQMLHMLDFTGIGIVAGEANQRNTDEPKDLLPILGSLYKNK
jgi:hypothetical protein